MNPEIDHPAVSNAIAPCARRVRRISLWGVVWRTVLVVILLLTFLPFLFMLSTSFKDAHQFYHSFWTPTWPPAWDNYAKACVDLKGYVINSLIVTTLTVLGVLAFSIMTGFLFARYRFPGKEFIYYMMLAMLMVPGILMLIPQFVWVQQLNLLNTYAVMVLPYIAGMQILGMFLLRSFFAQLDQALFESAQLDGAGLFRQIWHIALPLSKPVLGVVAIMSALGVWNSFLWPLVTATDESVTVLTVGVLRYATGRVLNNYGPMFAGYVISAIPLTILFALFTRAFMKGITSGALKG
jgi:ABC-type glycerol-3-phosphate transport system permease component